MQDLYVEQIVRANRKKGGGAGQKALIVAAALFAAITLLIDIRCILLFVIAGAAAWYLGNNQNQEYEYLFVNGQLDVDVVKTNKRKRLGSFQMEELECMAPKGSYRLDAYKGRSMKEIKAVTGSTGAPEYILVFKKEQNYVQVVLEPEEELMRAFRLSVPNKIFA